jgi:hypothetical protein
VNETRLTRCVSCTDAIRTPTKGVGYLHGTHDHIAARATAQTEMLQWRNLVRAIGDDVTYQIRRAAFRGCAFLNAASEFYDPEIPLRQVVAGHRRW